jgi:tight adherence protein B
MTAVALGALAATAVLLALPAAPPGRAAGRSAGPTWPEVPGRAREWLDEHLPERRRRRRDRQLPEALDRLASAVRAGDSVGAALGPVAAATPRPLGAELRRLARAVELGTPAPAALEAWGRSGESSADVRLAATALAIGAGAGGELARAVDGVAATLRERHELRREVQALATQARASAGVLAVAPLAFAVVVATVEPGAALFLVTEPTGLVCLALGLALEGVGAIWMNRITRSAG